MESSVSDNIAHKLTVEEYQRILAASDNIGRKLTVEEYHELDQSLDDQLVHVQGDLVRFRLPRGLTLSGNYNRQGELISLLFVNISGFTTPGFTVNNNIPYKLSVEEHGNFSIDDQPPNDTLYVPYVDRKEYFDIEEEGLIEDDFIKDDDFAEEISEEEARLIEAGWESITESYNKRIEEDRRIEEEYELKNDVYDESVVLIDEEDAYILIQRELSKKVVDRRIDDEGRMTMNERNLRYLNKLTEDKEAHRLQDIIEEEEFLASLIPKPSKVAKQTTAREDIYLAIAQLPKEEDLPTRSEVRSKETIVIDPTTGARKGSKIARFDLIPPDSLTALAEHFGVGAEKYDANNFLKGYKWSLSYAAMMRHANQFWSGEEEFDPETGSHHLIACAWHALALYEFTQRYPEKDDRACSDPSIAKIIRSNREISERIRSGNLSDEERIELGW